MLWWLLLKGPVSHTFVLFTCENLASIFYSRPVETKKKITVKLLKIKHTFRNRAYSKIIFHLHNLSTAPWRVFNNMTGDPNETCIVTLWELALYSAANDTRPQMILRPEMILKLDLKWSQTVNDPRCGPQMIPPERDEWHGVWSPGFFLNFCIYLFIYLFICLLIYIFIYLFSSTM